MILVNSFSLNMLERGLLGQGAKLTIRPCSLASAKSLAPFESRIGHETTARLVAAQLGVEVTPVRNSIEMQAGDTVLVAQYLGSRLPEGATTLPPGAELRYFLVSVDRESFRMEDAS